MRLLLSLSKFKTPPPRTTFTEFTNPKLLTPQTKPCAKQLQITTTVPPQQQGGEIERGGGRTRSLLPTTYYSRMSTAVGVSAVATSMASLTDHCIFLRTSTSRNPLPTSSIRRLNLKPSSSPGVVSYGLLPLRRNSRSWQLRTVCIVGEDGKGGAVEVKAAIVESAMTTVGSASEERGSSFKRVEERMVRKKREKHAYLVAAVLSSFGFTSMAIAAVYYRFSWHMEGGEIPVSEMVGTFALSVGAAVGMEFWARWAHRALWHASLWHMHESHHRPREGPFELNDVFAIINAVPAIALLAFGFFHSGLIPGLCFGAGLGITLFGMAYMFVHDGLVHRRFPVGPIANVPYFRRVAAAHQIHHSEKFDGVPYGLFLGPKELEEVGGSEELEKEISRRIKASSRTVSS